jgi:hypothetical protein
MNLCVEGQISASLRNCIGSDYYYSTYCAGTVFYYPIQKVDGADLKISNDLKTFKIIPNLGISALHPFL